MAEAASEARVKADYAFVMTRRVQMCFRRHSARENLRVRKMHYRNACIVQKFARRKVRRVVLAFDNVIELMDFEGVALCGCFGEGRPAG